MADIEKALIEAGEVIGNQDLGEFMSDNFWDAVDEVKELKKRKKKAGKR